LIVTTIVMMIADNVADCSSFATFVLIGVQERQFYLEKLEAIERLCMVAGAAPAPLIAWAVLMMCGSREHFGQ
jgi:hypothetical protein